MLNAVQFLHKPCLDHTVLCVGSGGLQATKPAYHCAVDCRSGAPFSITNCAAHDVQPLLPSAPKRSA